MKQDKMYLINKLFNNETIRTIWNNEEEKYYISVVDIVGVLSQSDNRRNYWKVLKHRLKQEGNESVINCNQLKLKSSDEKYYNTDVCDIEGMFRIIESVPSKNAEPIKEWIAKNRPIGLEENIKIAQSGGEVAKNTRLDIENRLKESVITKDNALSYKYIDENNEIESK